MWCRSHRDGAPGRVDIDMPFQDYPGDFVLHCHILNHEDGGMMARISVRRKYHRAAG
jgi:FtsP/CotA-like multicopper oxidase with cupredoxin domain